MSSADFRAYFQDLASRFLSHTLRADDGFGDRELDAAEARLGIELPESLRAYYLFVGRFAPFSSFHNLLRQPHQLAVEQGYLVYMDENQNVVSWGIASQDLREPDPVVHQRNNTPPAEWFSEDKAFTAFTLSMFEWYESSGIWNVRQ
jgi:hypothetical protein